MSDQQDVIVRDNPANRRFEAHVDGQLAGFGQYRLEPAQITFHHTFVDPAFEGRGIGNRLVGFQLDDARSRGLAVVPECRFVSSYIKRHPEYADLVADSDGDSEAGA